MRPVRKGKGETGKRLLAAAADVFARKDYRSATAAEISELAGANIAAINYHFGDKETLYAEAWRYAFSEAITAHPPDGGVPADRPADERLRGEIAALLRRIGDENNKEFWIAQKELANPTGLLLEVMRDEIDPLRQRMEGVIREFLGPNVDESQVQLSVISIMSMCTAPIPLRRWQKNQGEKSEFPRVLGDLDALIDHIVQFSLGGLCSIQRTAKQTPQIQGKKRKKGKELQ